MKKFVIFKKQQGEITNAYSVVTPEILATIPVDIIQKTIDIEDKLYSKEELEKLLKENI